MTKPATIIEAGCFVCSGKRSRSAVVFNRCVRAVFLDGVDGVLCAGLAGIAFSGEHDFTVILEAHAELASFVLVDFEFMSHFTPP